MTYDPETSDSKIMKTGMIRRLFTAVKERMSQYFFHVDNSGKSVMASYPNNHHLASISVESHAVDFETLLDNVNPMDISKMLLKSNSFILSDPDNAVYTITVLGSMLKAMPGFPTIGPFSHGIIPLTIELDGEPYDGFTVEVSDDETHDMITFTQPDDIADDSAIAITGTLDYSPGTFIFFGSEQNINLEELPGNYSVSLGGYASGVNAAAFNNSYASGEYSHAEGTGQASGDFSHAEGQSTRASGNSSHAEGAVTTASGKYSHAEGNNAEATGEASHAEGVTVTASGKYSHVEGLSSIADGNCSHAEGFNTRANGAYSHVQGTNTVTNMNNQFVFGQWNTIDTNTMSPALEIVGCGTSENDRKCARVLTNNGHEMLKGALWLGGVDIDGDTPYSAVRYNTSTGNLEYWRNATVGWTAIGGGAQ